MSKIIHVTGSLPPLRCGVGFYTNRLLTEMPGEFDVLTTKGLNKHQNAKQTKFVKNWRIRNLLKMYKACNNYNLVHIQYPAIGYKRELGINLLPHLLRLFTKAKIVITLHEYHGSGLLGKTRNIVTVLPAHKIFVSNPYDFESLPSFIRRKSEIVPISSNIVVVKKNDDKFNNLIKEAGFNNKEKIVSYFGFPFLNKGIETLIDAAVIGKFQLIVFSTLNKNDSYQNSLLDKIKQARKAGAKIHLVGFLEDKEFSETIQGCDMFVLPQQLPLTAKSSTAITAAIHKLVIVSKSAEFPGFNQPFVNGKNSILISDMNPESLAKAIQDAPSKSAFLDELNKLSEYFSWSKIVEKHQSTYRELLS